MVLTKPRLLVAAGNAATLVISIFSSQTPLTMDQCFVPNCNHRVVAFNCNFFQFPKLKEEKKQWGKLIIGNTTPTTASRVCICHFVDGEKDNGPTLFNSECQFDKPDAGSNQSERAPATLQKNFQIDSELCLRRELDALKAAHIDKEKRYSVKPMDDDIVRFETGLPNKMMFKMIAGYVERFQGEMNYFCGWKVESVTLEDQVLMTLMKLRHNYTIPYLAKLFDCYTATVQNIIVTLMHTLHHLLYKDCMKEVPSKEKNKTSLPGFVFFGNTRMAVKCIDIEIAAPPNMSHQTSFKVLLGVAPNAIITYVSPLYPASTSDKAVVEKSGILSHFVEGDLIIADKGWYIQDIVPEGVSVNIPPFSNKGKFSVSEVKMTKNISVGRSHVDRANSCLKKFKALRLIPVFLGYHAEILVQLCAALVNLQTTPLSIS